MATTNDRSRRIASVLAILLALTFSAPVFAGSYDRDLQATSTAPAPELESTETPTAEPTPEPEPTEVPEATFDVAGVEWTSVPTSEDFETAGVEWTANGFTFQGVEWTFLRTNARGYTVWRISSDGVEETAVGRLGVEWTALAH